MLLSVLPAVPPVSALLLEPAVEPAVVFLSPAVEPAVAFLSPSVLFLSVSAVVELSAVVLFPSVPAVEPPISVAVATYMLGMKGLLYC